MATVKIILRKNSQNSINECPLRVRLFHKGAIKEITISGTRVLPSKWNAKKQRVLGNRDLNVRLKNMRLKYESIINNYEAQGIEIDLEDIHNVVTGKNSLRTKRVYKSRSTVKQYLEEVMTVNPEFKYNTRKNYITLLKYIKSDYNDLKLIDVNAGLMNNMEAQMLRSGLHLNTVHTKLKCLKATVRKAALEKIIPPPELAGFKYRKLPTKKPHLTLVELKQLRSHLLKLKKDSLKESVLKAYLWACYSCGMRFGDCCLLSYQNFNIQTNNRVRLSYTMSKTEKEITCILNTTAIQLIEVEKIGSNELVFKLFKEKDRYLTGDKLKAKQESRNVIVNKNLKAIMQELEIGKHITFHTSRHSFCTNALSLGIDHFTLKEIAGMTLRTLESTYGKVLEESKTKALEKFDSDK